MYIIVINFIKIIIIITRMQKQNYKYYNDYNSLASKNTYGKSGLQEFSVF